MSWWWLEKLIDASTLSAPCKHVLQTLSRQINPPKDWDAARTEAWDPETHREALTVRYDRARLSLLTSYSMDSVRRVMKELTASKDEAGQRLDPVLYLDRPARQHYVATYVFDVAALRRRRNPRLVALDEARKQRWAARQACQRAWWAAARQASDPERAQRTQDQPPDAEDRPDNLPTQRAQDTPPERQGTQDTPPEVPRGLKISPPFTSSKLSPLQSLSPFLGDAESAPPAFKTKPVTGDRSQGRRRTRPTPIEAPPPADIPITPELEAWRDEYAPGLNLGRAIRKFLHYARAKGITNADWTAAFGFFVMHGQDQQAAQVRERQAALAQRREEEAAAWEALLAKKQAEEDARFPGGPAAWEHVSGVYGRHKACGEYHQFARTCSVEIPAAAD